MYVSVILDQVRRVDKDLSDRRQDAGFKIGLNQTVPCRRTVRLDLMVSEYLLDSKKVEPIANGNDMVEILHFQVRYTPFDAFRSI